MGFIANSLLLGVALSMDAFSVSVANGLFMPEMGVKRKFYIAGTFAFFQALMPILGYFCLHTLIGALPVFTAAVPYIALAILGYLGVKMIISGARRKPEDKMPALSGEALLVQGIATSIDALSVGLTMAEHTPLSALFAALIIAAVTFVICLTGVYFGSFLGEKISGKAEILGGVILVFIGAEIFFKGILLMN